MMRELLCSPTSFLFKIKKEYASVCVKSSASFGIPPTPQEILNPAGHQREHPRKQQKVM